MSDEVCGGDRNSIEKNRGNPCEIKGNGTEGDNEEATEGNHVISA